MKKTGPISGFTSLAVENVLVQDGFGNFFAVFPCPKWVIDRFSWEGVPKAVQGIQSAYFTPHPYGLVAVVGTGFPANRASTAKRT